MRNMTLLLAQHVGLWTISSWTQWTRPFGVLTFSGNRMWAWPHLLVWIRWRSGRRKHAAKSPRKIPRVIACSRPELRMNGISILDSLGQRMYQDCLTLLNQRRTSFLLPSTLLCETHWWLRTSTKQPGLAFKWVMKSRCSLNCILITLF